MPGALERRGVSIENRRTLFYSVCIPIRILLALSILVTPTPIVFLGAIFIAYVNFSSRGVVRWNRSVHGFFSALIAVISLFSKRLALVAALCDIVYGASTLTF